MVTKTIVSNMRIDRLRESIYNDGSNFGKPSKIYHWVGGNRYPSDDVLEEIKLNGLSFTYGGWASIELVCPNRPKGIFFYGPEMVEKKLATRNMLEVNISDLDQSKLFAWPAGLSYAADKATSGIELVEGTKELLSEAQPVLFENFNGEFAAEFIYCGDIPSSVISFKEGS